MGGESYSDGFGDIPEAPRVILSGSRDPSPTDLCFDHIVEMVGGIDIAEVVKFVFDFGPDERGEGIVAFDGD